MTDAPLILGIGPHPQVPTDGVILQGILSLLGEALVNFDFLHLELDDFSVQNYEPDAEPDLIIQCGSPFLWDGMQFSHKYKNFRNIIGTHPEVPILMCGIGSCFPLDFTPERLTQVASDIRTNTQELFSDPRVTIIARDIEAKRILEPLTDRLHLLPCPGFFAPTEGTSLREELLIVWYDPRLGLSKAYWEDERRFDQYVSQFRDTYESYRETHAVRIVAAYDYEVDTARALGLFPEEKITVMKSPEQTLKYTQVTDVYSGRVHFAVPAFAAGAKTILVPIDSRHKTLEDFRMSFHSHQAEFSLGYQNVIKGILFS